MPRGEIQVNFEYGAALARADAAERRGGHDAGGRDLQESAAAHATGKHSLIIVYSLSDGSFP